MTSGMVSIKRHGTCRQDRQCPVCGALTCSDCTGKDGKTCDNHRKEGEAMTTETVEQAEAREAVVRLASSHRALLASLEDVLPLAQAYVDASGKTGKLWSKPSSAYTNWSQDELRRRLSVKIDSALAAAKEVQA